MGIKLDFCYFGYLRVYLLLLLESFWFITVVYILLKVYIKENVSVYDFLLFTKL